MLKIVDEMSSLKCVLKCDENVVQCCRMLNNVSENVKKKCWQMLECKCGTNVIQCQRKCDQLWFNVIKCWKMSDNVCTMLAICFNITPSSCKRWTVFIGSMRLPLMPVALATGVGGMIGRSASLYAISVPRLMWVRPKIFSMAGKSRVLQPHHST